jgi:uncharacterized RDD family membrane protein YckC
MSHPNLLKRLLVALYDGLLILATIFFATALTLPFTKGNIAAENKIYMSLYLLVVIYIFYGWFWTHGGQTLGMRAWKQKLISLDGNAISWQQSFIRVITGLPAWLLFIVGLILWIKADIAETLTAIPGWVFALTGFIWVLLNNKNNSWRDKLSGTQVVIVNEHN